MAMGEPWGKRGLAGGGGGEEQNRGVTNREGIGLIYLQVNVETEVKSTGTGPWGFSGERGGLGRMSQILAAGLGSSGALWSSLVGVCQEKQVRMEGPRAEELQEQQVTRLCMSLYWGYCVGKSRVWPSLEGEGKCACGALFAFFSQTVPRKTGRSYKAGHDEASPALSNLSSSSIGVLVSA